MLAHHQWPLSEFPDPSREPQLWERVAFHPVQKAATGTAFLDVRDTLLVCALTEQIEHVFYSIP